MASERSVATRWALRYALATFIVVSAVLLFHYVQTRERIARDAELLLRLQANELIGTLQRNPGDIGAIERYLDRHAAMGYRVLRLGFRVLDADGHAVVERGSFAEHAFPVPERLPQRPGEALVSELDVGEAYPFFTMVVRAPHGWVEAAIDTYLFARSAREIRNLALLSVPVVLLLTTGIGVALARSSLQPLRRIILAAERISATRLNEHVPTSGSGDELDRLAAAFNAMTDRIAAGVERMRRFSADAAHELRTPVSLMRNRLEAALERPRDAAEDRALIEALLGDVDRLSSTIRAMLRLAHSETGLDAERLQRTDLAPLLAGVVDFFRPVAQEASVSLALDAPGPAVVTGDPAWLHQLFANLVDNALKFTPAGGSVRVSLRLEEAAGRSGPLACVRVEDTGCGIPWHEHERIFESFHRVQSPQAQPGAGLGLPLAREIARAHGGDVTLESEPGRGACFEVRLPAAPGSAALSAEAAAPPAPPRAEAPKPD